MDICLLAYDLGQVTDEEPDLDTRPTELLRDTWLPLWPASQEPAMESERVMQFLCTTLPLVTTEEARLN